MASGTTRIGSTSSFLATEVVVVLPSALLVPPKLIWSSSKEVEPFGGVSVISRHEATMDFGALARPLIVKAVHTPHP